MHYTSFSRWKKFACKRFIQIWNIFCQGECGSDTSAIEFTKVQTEVRLSGKDVLRIGVLKSVFHVCETKIVVVHSKLSRAAKAQLQKDVQMLNGVLVSTWSPNITHLAMKEIVLNVKVTQALACNCPIVTCQYFKSLATAVQSGSQNLPLCSNFVPEIADEGLNKNECSFTQDVRRLTLFAGKTFVFLSEKQSNRLGDTCKFAGASVILVCDPKFDIKVVSDENTLVVSGYEAQNSIGEVTFESLQEKMIEASSRFIQEFEIGLALLYCSIEMYCNPKFDLPPDGTFTSATLSEPLQSVTASEKFGDAQPGPSTSKVPETVDIDLTETDIIPQTKPLEKEKISARKRRFDAEQRNSSSNKVAKTLIVDEDALLDLNQSKKKPKPAPKKKQNEKNRTGDKTTLDAIEANAAKLGNIKPVPVVNDSDDDMEDLPDSCIADDSLWTNSNIPKVEPIDQEHQFYDTDVPKPESFPQSEKITIPETVTEVPQTPLESQECLSSLIKTEVLDETQTISHKTKSPRRQTTSGWMDSQNYTKSEDYSNVDPDLPFKDLTNIVHVSLVVSKQTNKPSSTHNITGATNFKRFKKVLPSYYNSGSQTNTAQSLEPPKIIGGRDLYCHDNRIENDHVIDDWVFPQSQQESQQSQDSNPFRRGKT